MFPSKVPLTFVLLLSSSTTLAQFNYISAPNGVTPYCQSTSTYRPTASPTYSFHSFAYSQNETSRQATALPTPKTKTTYAPAYPTLSSLVPNLSTTTWGNWNPNATTTATDASNPYGQAAFSSQWSNVNLTSFSTGLYSTTVSPIPVPTGELVFPPPLNFDSQSCLQFPHDFMFGVASAAAQLEGAVADEGRTPSFAEILGQFLNMSGQPSAPGVASSPVTISNDFVTDENYYLYKQDILRLASIGIKYYSFSISWPRILPFTFPGTPVNQHALDHYDDLINFVLAQGMVPVVTLYHWDTPLELLGGPHNYIQTLSGRNYYSGIFNFGFANSTWEDAFVNYGKIVMTHFADRVPLWVTINEPQLGSTNGSAIYTVLKSHARLSHFYHDQINGTGRVSLKHAFPPGQPQNPLNASHVNATQHYNDFYLGTWLNPLVLGKDYPDAYKMTIQDHVPLNSSDLAYMKGTMDYISQDSYSGTVIYPVGNVVTCAANNATTNQYYPSCVGQTEMTSLGWDIGYHEEYVGYTSPKYLRTQLNYLYNTYQVPVLVSEFGMSQRYEAFQSLGDLRYDSYRSDFFRANMQAILESIWYDNVEVIGAFMWSFLDNWEWGSFDHHLGLQYVNRTSQERVYKRSLFDVIDFVESRRMPAPA